MPTAMLPALPEVDSLFRIGVDRYHDMIAKGILGAEDRIELLDGLLVKKMSKNAPHIFVSEILRDLLQALLPSNWFINSQNPVSADDSEPEPDLAIVRGRRVDYLDRNPPNADEVALIVEVADSSLARDRNKRRIYARAGFAMYWIVNLEESLIEVFSEPTGTGADADYRRRTDYTSLHFIPLTINGEDYGTIAVSEVLPRAPQVNPI